VKAVAGVARSALLAFSFLLHPAVLHVIILEAPRVPVMEFRNPYLVVYATEPFCAATAARPSCQDVLVVRHDAPERTAATGYR
jgi:hypothetical protein